MHNPFHHGHDAHCSVYVLEQLFFGADTPVPFVLIGLFVPFGLVTLPSSRYRYRAVERFQIRAPPLF